MGTHPKNNLYVRKWRENNHELHQERSRKYAKTYADFKRQQRLLFNIDITFFY